jgi:cysteine-rich repeat protein
VRDPGKGETCDDGNSIGGDGCSGNCQVNEACGNGLLDQGEYCESNNQFTATCDPDCTQPVCGDGVRNAVCG